MSPGGENGHNGAWVPTNANQANRLITPPDGSHLRSAPIVLGMRLSGPVDVDRLGASLSCVMRAHTSLRTYFPERTTVAYGRCQPADRVSWPLNTVDLTGLTDNERSTAEEHWVGWLYSAFSPDSFPLCRAVLLRYPEYVVLGVSVDHLIFDGLSEAPFLDDLAAAYNSLEVGGEVTLAGSDASKFAAMERQFIESAAGSRALAYWKSVWPSAGPYPEISFPDQSSPPVPDDRTSGKSRHIAAGVFAAQQDRLGSTHYSVFCMAAAAIFMGIREVTGRNDSGIIIPSHRRPYINDGDQMIGFLSNKLILRPDLTGARDFKAVAEVTGDTLLNAMEHEMMPFEHLISLWAPDRCGWRPTYPYISLNAVTEAEPRIFGRAQATAEPLHTGGLLRGAGIPIWLEAANGFVTLNYDCPDAVPVHYVESVIDNAITSITP